MKFFNKPALLFFTLVLLLTGCVRSASLPVDRTLIPPAAAETSTPTIEVTAQPVEPSAALSTATEAVNPAGVAETPGAVEYDLGETTILQVNFPEDSRFREMPVRLNGVIAAPTGDARPYPVVLILHGTHPGCPIPPGDHVDRWPCTPEDEQPNYRGFAYLVEKLAEQGYIALSININAENTFGFGEPVPGERLEQLIDLNLKALAEANAGGENNFGIELQDRVDLQRLAFVGHSRGGEGAYFFVQNKDLGAPDAYDRFGYGPVAGLLMIAPAVTHGEAAGSTVPVSIILPACDGDVVFQDGQHYYEETRLDQGQNLPASSVWLEKANHNFFNENLSDDLMGHPDRPDCETILQPDEQRNFLVTYATDFLETLFNSDQETTQLARSRLGLDVTQPAPDELYGKDARLAVLLSAGERLPLLVPFSESELETNLAGGTVETAGMSTHYCKPGYYAPAQVPGSEPCKRVNLIIPANPAMLVLSWWQPGATMRLSLPEGSQDFSAYQGISLRAALDPLSGLNTPGSPQAFSVQLTDTLGNTASVQTRADEPALQFPAGYERENEFFGGGFFTGRVPLTTVRLPLSAFTGVDLTGINEISLSFDQTPSGTLFIGDVELVR